MQTSLAFKNVPELTDLSMNGLTEKEANTDVMHMQLSAKLS